MCTENIEELIADSEEQKQKNYLMRTKIVSELVGKEEEYVHTLKALAQLIARLKSSAEDSNKVISLDDILNIFSSWEMLSKCHEDLLTMFKDRLAHWQDKPLIGDVFVDKVRIVTRVKRENSCITDKYLQHTGFFKLYRHYVTNRQEQIKALEDALASSPMFVIAITVRVVPLLSCHCSHLHFPGTRSYGKEEDREDVRRAVPPPVELLFHAARTVAQYES